MTDDPWFLLNYMHLFVPTPWYFPKPTTTTTNTLVLNQVILGPLSSLSLFEYKDHMIKVTWIIMSNMLILKMHQMS